MSSPNPVSSLTPQFSLNTTTAETDKRSTSSVPNPSAADDHSDFINSFLLNNQNFSPATSASSTKKLTEEDKPSNKTEYDSFHADFSSFLNEALTEPMESLSDPPKDDSAEPGQKSQRETAYSNGEHSSMANKEYTASNITALYQQPQESSPNTFDTLDNEVSSAQDILSVCEETKLLPKTPFLFQIPFQPNVHFHLNLYYLKTLFTA